MTRDTYLRGLLIALAAGLALAALLKLIAGARWFSFYGWAAAALITLPAVAYLLLGRLRTIGRSRWLAALYVVPVALLALIQIGYWTAFFTYGPTDATLGIVREMVRINLGPVFPWLGGALLLLWAWLLVRTSARQS